MRKFRFLILFVGLLAGGCSVNHQRELQAVVKAAVVHAEYEQALAYEKCGQAESCPKADEYERYINLGYMLADMLEKPLPEDTIEKVVYVVDCVITAMETQEDLDPKMLMYAKQIRILAEALLPQKGLDENDETDVF